MKLNAEQINKIKEIAEEYDFDYAAIGFRSQDVPFELGSIDHVSHIWDNGDDTGEDLPGICVCSVKLVDRNPDYYGEHCAVIATARTRANTSSVTPKLSQSSHKEE